MEILENVLKKEIHKNFNKKIALLCIGSKKIIGDALGPYVGEKLIHTKLKNKIIIKGTLTEPIHYLNIREQLEYLNKQYKDLFTIIIDSSLYVKSYIGKVIITKNKVVLGKALDKNQYVLGNLAIKGIVGVDTGNYSENIYNLKKVSKSLILKMSEKITNQILKAID